MEENNSAVFVDSNYFIALGNPDDRLHSHALNITDLLDDGNVLVVISNLIFIEIVTVLSQRVGREIAWKVGRDLVEDPNVQIIHIDPEVQEESWEIFQKVAQKDISFVDCSTIAVMQSEGIDTLLTFDDDFQRLKKQFRFKLWDGKK